MSLKTTLVLIATIRVDRISAKKILSGDYTAEIFKGNIKVVIPKEYRIVRCGEGYSLTKAEIPSFDNVPEQAGDQCCNGGRACGQCRVCSTAANGPRAEQQCGESRVLRLSKGQPSCFQQYFTGSDQF